MKLTVVIPMYNEAKNAPNTVAALKKFAADHPGREYEFILVNDGSKDDCQSLAEKAAAGDSAFRILGYADNRGKGAAVREGMLVSTGDAVIFTDCDLAYGLEAVHRMADQWEQTDADIVIGSRNLAKDGYEGYTFKRKLMSKVYIKVLNFAAGFRHSDSQSGIKCFSAEAAHEVFALCRVNRFAFDLEALLIAERRGYTVGEMAVKVINHAEGESKVSVVKDTLRMLRDIRIMKKRIVKEIPKK